MIGAPTVIEAPARPVLHLSGQRLRSALAGLIKASEPVGGIERFAAIVAHEPLGVMWRMHEAVCLHRAAQPLGKCEAALSLPVGKLSWDSKSEGRGSLVPR